MQGIHASRLTPKNQNLIFDVGLHRGEDAEFYLKKGFRVVAFEANPELVTMCTARLRSSIQDGSLTIVAGAIVDCETLAAGHQTVPFYRNESGSLWGTIQSEWAERNERAGSPSLRIEVGVVDFAAAIEKHGIPHYMKVDIEGCDTICLRALATFRERPDYISIESDKTSFGKIREEIRLLRSLGYETFKVIEQSAVASQTTPCPPREGSYAAHSFDTSSSGLFGAELPGEWMTHREVLSVYRLVRLGYYLLGDSGVLNRSFRGASRLRRLARTFLRRLVGEEVPGWYDTHARLRQSNEVTFVATELL